MADQIKGKRKYPFVVVPKTLIQSDLPHEAKLLYVVLASHADNETGSAYPSYDVLEKETGIRRNNIKWALDKLVAANWITKQRRFSGVTLYTVALDCPFSTTDTEIPEYHNVTAVSSINVDTNGSSNAVTTSSINVDTLTRLTSLDPLTRLDAAAPKQAPELAHEKFAIPSEDRAKRMIANAKVSDESIRQTMLDFHALFPDVTYQATQWKAGAKTLRDSYGGDPALLKAGADLARKQNMLPSYPGGLVWAVDKAKAAYRVLGEAANVDESVDAQGNAVYRVQS